MNFSKEELQQVEQLASIFLPISDIAVILGKHPDELREDIKNRSTDVSKCYYRGKATSRVELHTQEMMLAKVGSPLALQNAADNLMSMEDDE